jgi:hypothetical protein
MAAPRRRIVRPPAVADLGRQHRQRCQQRLRDTLARDRAALGRWMSRLRRAFHAVEKLQRQIARADRHLSRLEDT